MHYPHLSSTTSRTPPPPAPFPYTTLFRSHCAVATALPEEELPADATVELHDRVAHALRAPPLLQVLGLGQDVEDALARRVEDARDRKSTRLNSSHRTNSYAVFCLKTRRNH